jgi:hypothetical protein
MQTAIPSSRAFSMEAFKIRSACSVVICMPCPPVGSGQLVDLITRAVPIRSSSIPWSQNAAVGRREATDIALQQPEANR